MKNLFRASMLTLAFLIFLSACGKAEPAKDNNQTQGGDSGTEAGEPVIDEPVDEEPVFYDLAGYEFHILQQYDTESPFHLGVGTTYADYYYDRVKYIEENYNCTFNLDGGQGVTSLKGKVSSAIGAGEKVGEMIFSQGDNIQGALAAKGFLLPLTEVKDLLDYENSAKFGTVNMQEPTIINGVPYGVVPSMWPSKTVDGNIGTVICINETYIKDNSLTDPRDMNENKTWTWDGFEEQLPSWTLQEGEDTIKALIANTYSFTLGFLGSNGMRMLYNDGNANLPGYDDPRVVKSIDWARGIITDYASDLELVSHYTSYDNLMAGEYTMAVIEANDVRTIAETMKDFGIVPFPNGPEIEYGEQQTYFSRIDTASIILNAVNEEYAAICIDALFEPFPGYETVEDIKESLFNTMFFDMRDVEYYMSLVKNTNSLYYSYNGYTFFETIANKLTSSTGTEIVETLGTRLQKVIDEAILPNQEYVNAHRS